MATFEEAIPLLWKQEHVTDPQNPTYGLNLEDWRLGRVELAAAGDIVVRDAKSLRDKSESFYRTAYWHKLFDLIDSQEVANRIFLFSAHAGHQPSIKLLQRTLRQMGSYPLVADDGDFGQATLAATNSLEAEPLIARLRQAQAEYYEQLGQKDQRLARFLPAWQRRLES